METFSTDELRKLPFLKRIPQDRRITRLQTYFDVTTREWHLYLPVRPGELRRIMDGEVITGSYYSMAPADPLNDFEFPLSTLITTRLSFEDMLSVLDFIESDVHRCAAVLEKYHAFSFETSSDRLRASLLVTSEFEYLLYLLRSLYDLIQKAVTNIARRLVFIEDGKKRPLSELPDSFAKVALHGESLRTAEHIRTKWNLPAPLAAWYAQEAPFFMELRKLRDDIAHRGCSTPTVFGTEWGFAISPDEAPWNSFGCWPVEQRWNGRLGSFRAIFAQFIAHALGATTRFADGLSSSVQLPESIADDLRSYVRSPLGNRIVGLPQMITQPWEKRDLATGKRA